MAILQRIGTGIGLAIGALIALLVAILMFWFWYQGDWGVLNIIFLILAAVLLIVGFFASVTRFGPMLLVASIGLSLIVMLFSLYALLFADEDPLNGAVDPSAQPTTVQTTPPPDPGADPDAGTPPPAADPGPNVAVPGEQHIEDQRAEATRQGGQIDGMDFEAPYSNQELRALGDWELDYIRDNPNDPQITALARELGLGSNADGNDLADWMEDDAELRAVNADGLDVTHIRFQDDGDIDFERKETLPANTLVWFSERTGNPVALWRNLDYLKDPSPRTK